MDEVPTAPPVAARKKTDFFKFFLFFAFLISMALVFLSNRNASELCDRYCNEALNLKAAYSSFQGCMCYDKLKPRSGISPDFSFPTTTTVAAASIR